MGYINHIIYVKWEISLYSHTHNHIHFFQSLLILSYTPYPPSSHLLLLFLEIVNFLSKGMTLKVSDLSHKTYFLTILEAGKARLRYSKVSFWKYLPSACRDPSCCIVTWTLLCAHVSLMSLLIPKFPSIKLSISPKLGSFLIVF